MDFREYIERNCEFETHYPSSLYREISADSIPLLDTLVGRRVKDSKKGEGYIESIICYEDATVMVRFDDLGQTSSFDISSEDLELLQ